MIKSVYNKNNSKFLGTPYTSKRSAITLLSCLDLNSNLIKKCPAWTSDKMFNHYVSIGCITNRERLLKLPFKILNEFYIHCLAYDFYNPNKLDPILIEKDTSNDLIEKIDSDTESIDEDILRLENQAENILINRHNDWTFFVRN